MAQRLIDAERLKRHYAWWGSKTSSEVLKEFKHTFDIIVDLQPTVATPEIVRCKECKYWMGKETDSKDVDSVCKYWETDGLYKDDFCSYGERREDEESTKRAD